MNKSLWKATDNEIKYRTVYGELAYDTTSVITNVTHCMKSESLLDHYCEYIEGLEMC